MDCSRAIRFFAGWALRKRGRRVSPPVCCSRRSGGRAAAAGLAYLAEALVEERLGLRRNVHGHAPELLVHLRVHALLLAVLHLNGQAPDEEHSFLRERRRQRLGLRPVSGHAEFDLPHERVLVPLERVLVARRPRLCAQRQCVRHQDDAALPFPGRRAFAVFAARHLAEPARRHSAPIRRRSGPALHQVRQVRAAPGEHDEPHEQGGSAPSPGGVRRDGREGPLTRKQKAEAPRWGPRGPGPEQEALGGRRRRRGGGHRATLARYLSPAGGGGG